MIDKPEPRIEPCPFCGEHCFRHWHYEGPSEEPSYCFHVYCSRCDYHGPVHLTQAEAIAAHNRVSRLVTAGEERDREIERLREVLKEVEWMGGAGTECPMCKGGSMEGIHADWCKLGAALAKPEGDTDAG